VSREVVRVGDVWGNPDRFRVASIRPVSNGADALDEFGTAHMAIAADGCPLFDNWVLVSRAEPERELVGEWWELRNTDGFSVADLNYGIAYSWKYESAQDAKDHRSDGDHRIVHVRRYKVRRG
jgi:hypothetical protein